MTEWELADWLNFRPIAQDPDVMRYIDSGELWSDKRVRYFVQAQIREARLYGFCLWKLIEKATGTLIGFCGLQHYEGEIEIGWWLARAYWGKGLGTEAARIALLDAFQRTRLPRVIAMAQPENRSSTHIMEKLGMQFERNALRNGIKVVVYGIANTQAVAGVSEERDSGLGSGTRGKVPSLRVPQSLAPLPASTPALLCNTRRTASSRRWYPYPACRTHTRCWRELDSGCPAIVATRR